jgi:hypothetical protein
MSYRLEFDSFGRDMVGDMDFQPNGLASPVVSPPPRMTHQSSSSPFPDMLMNPSAQVALMRPPPRETKSSVERELSTIEEFIDEARSSHSSLLASICSYVTESTETHLLSTTSSIKQHYEHILEQQHLEATNKIKELERELAEMTGKYHHLQGEYSKLEDKLEKRTDNITQYINNHHIQRSDVTNKSSLISYFRAWKSISKRHCRAKKLEKFVDRTETEALLHQYFVHLQVNRLHEKAERKLSEVKFKHETLSNEVRVLSDIIIWKYVFFWSNTRIIQMAKGYETEIAQLKQQNDEAQQQIQVEIEKRKHLEADMRTLFMQSMSQMNMQALSLFRKVEGSIDMSAFHDIASFAGAQTEEKSNADIFQQDSSLSVTNLSINVAHDLDAGSTSHTVESPTSLSPQPRSVISTSSTVPFFSPMQIPSTSSGFQQMATGSQYRQMEQSQQSLHQKQQYQMSSLPNEQVQIRDKYHYDRLSDMYKNAIPAIAPANKTQQPTSAPSQTSKSNQRNVNSTNNRSSIPNSFGTRSPGPPTSATKQTLISRRVSSASNNNGKK